MTYAQQEIQQYQQFKEALPAALASFLSGAEWEPAVLTFEVSAEPVHQLAAGA
jgi:ADP-ribosylglycohydrolase